MADLTVSSVVDGFMDETTAAGCRAALELWITQTSSSALTINSGHTIRLRTTGATDLTLPISGSLLTTASTVADLAVSTSAQLRGIISDETGSGGGLVFATGPTISAPTLTGNTTVTTVNKVAITAPATAATLTLANNSTLATSGAFAITLTTLAGSGVTLPATGTLYGTETGSITSAQLKASLTDETGSGAAVFATSPTLVTPALGVATCTSINGLIPTGSGSSQLEMVSTSILVTGGADVEFICAGTVAITFPTVAGTLATLAGTETLSNKTLTTPVIGVATGTSLAVSGLLTSSSATAGIGYATGAGGTVTQSTNRTTGVTLNKITGQITTNNASLAAEASADFVVTNSACALADVPVLAIQSGSNSGGTIVSVIGVAAGSFTIRVHNGNAAAGTAETGAIVINFVIIKAASA